MKTTIVLFIILMSAQIAPAQKLVACDISAAINNEEAFNQRAKMTTDASGTNIRSGPGKNFPIVKTLKNASGFVFDIDASQGDWMRIKNYFEVAADGKQPFRGWIYAPSLFLKVEYEYGSGQASRFVSNLYAAPDWKAKFLLPKNNNIGSQGESVNDVVSLRACQGKWSKVEFEGTIGWLNPVSQCSALWDSCGER